MARKDEIDPRCWTGDWFGAVPEEELDPSDTDVDPFLDAMATQPLPEEAMKEIARLSMLWPERRR